MNKELKSRLMVTYGYLLGLDGLSVGQGLFGVVERMKVPRSAIEPLQELLFPKGDTITIKKPEKYNTEGATDVSK